MKTYIIDNLDIIKEITRRDIYKKIILHIDNKKKEAKYEGDYTLFELTERVEYIRIKPLLKELENIC